MEERPIHIGLVGCGPRGLSVLERILSIAETRLNQVVVIDIFDPGELGTGVHRRGQPDYLALNTVAGQLGVFPDLESLGQLPGARGRDGPSFFDWCQQKKIKISSRSGLSNAEGRDVRPDDFLPRSLLGFYLFESFNEIIEGAPRNVSINIYNDFVEEIVGLDDCLFKIRTSSGEFHSLEKLVLTIGHGHDLRKKFCISDRYDDLNCEGMVSAKENEEVLIEGFGLVAMDIISALTVGKGGEHECVEHQEYYKASGREPVLLIQSRCGVPFRARPACLTRFPRHQAVILTKSRVAHLRAQLIDGQFDFELDILPLMIIEMRAAAVAALFGGSDIKERLRLLRLFRSEGAVQEGGMEACEELVREYEARSEAFDFQDILASSLPEDLEEGHYHDWVCLELERDLCEARKGLMSPIKAAAEVWRDLRDELREVVDFGGLTTASHQCFYGRWYQTINRLVAGPQMERHIEILSLVKAGILRFIHPAVSQPTANKCRRIASHVESPKVTETGSALVRSLAEHGLIRSIGDTSIVSGIDLNRSCNPLTNSGHSAKNVWVLGPLAEGACYYNHYISSPGSPSRLFMDAHRVANSILCSVK